MLQVTSEVVKYDALFIGFLQTNIFLLLAHKLPFVIKIKDKNFVVGRCRF